MIGKEWLSNLHPSMPGSSQDKRVVKVAQSRIIACVGVDSFFFITRSQNEAGVAALSQQHHIRFNGVVLPLSRTGKQFGAPFVRVVSHGAVHKFPCTAKGFPLFGLTCRE